VAILGDKVFMVTDNAHLIALNRTTGQVVWEAVMPDEPQHYGSTVAPLIVKDMVIAGVSGGDWGIRGFLAAYKASTGERVWRFWTIPAKGEPGIETWKGGESKDGGGPTWLTGSYDPGTDTLYWPTGNPFPDSNDRDRPGDNLYTNCILALNPDTGKLKWHYQFTPHDVHDWDATEPPVLVDARYRGQDRKLMLFANRNGFFYVLDRTNGQVLLAKPFIKRLTWASGIGPDGRPQLTPEGDVICPDTATNWNATAFSPVTRLYYVMAFEKCVVGLSPGGWKKAPPQEAPGMKYLRALDIESGKIVWEKPQIGPGEGKRCTGVLATAGGLLLHGDPNGDFVALDERDGKTLWHFPTNGEAKASPMTFMVGGKQFIAVAIGPNIVCFGLP
jgi:PQQ-dependent dehydrogenase (methanol/ethanol family)